MQHSEIMAILTGQAERHQCNGGACGYCQALADTGAALTMAYLRALKGPTHTRLAVVAYLRKVGELDAPEDSAELAPCPD